MNRIRDLREDRDLRQIDLANAVKIDQRTLSNYETGKTNPDSEALIKLSDFFDVSIDYLVGRKRKSSGNEDDILKRIEVIQIELDALKKSIKK